MNNVILIGMPGCGKSSEGVLLAKVLKKDFVDTDLLIQNVEGMTLQQIIDIRGNAYFRDLEKEVLLHFEGDNYIVATGGSAVYYPEAMDHFRQGGKIVYIKLPVETIIKRLNNIKTRGISLEPGQTIEDLYNERIPLYEKEADIIVDTTGLEIEESVAKIAEAVK